MGRCIDDSRTDSKEEVEIFSFSKEEKETVLNFKYDEGVWNVWSSVPNHITRLLKLKGANIQVDSVSETGYITSVKGTLSKKMISFRNAKIDFNDSNDDLNEGYDTSTDEED